MSVEDIRRGHKKSCPEPQCCCFNAYLDRLITEIQAEMPCYRSATIPGYDCLAINRDVAAYPKPGVVMAAVCPSCAARAKLTELARIGGLPAAAVVVE